MASNTLLAGELARRNNSKENEPRTEAIEYNVASGQVEAINNNENSSDWKMALYHQSTPQQQQSNRCDQKPMNCGNFRSPAFSVSLHDLIGIDSVGSSQTMLDDPTKIGTHFSNHSSLVTSLSSSRECSPEKKGPTLLFPKSPMGSKIGGSPIATGAGSWFPSSNAQLRPAVAAAISMSHLPVFAAWSDA